MNKLLLKIFIALFIISIAVGFIAKKSYENKISNLLIDLDKTNKLIVEKDQVIGKQASVLRNKDDLLRQMDKSLKDAIKKRNLLATKLVQIQLRFDSLSSTITDFEQITTPEGIRFYRFGPIAWGIFDVVGQITSETKPKGITLDFYQREPFSLQMTFAETVDGKLSYLFAKSSWEGVKIDTMALNIIHQKKPWYKKLYLEFAFGSSLNKNRPLMLDMGLGYSKMGVRLQIDASGRSYFFNYRINPF